MENRKLIRSDRAGVFFGDIVKTDGQTVTIKNSRRIWRWEGAASLSELAQRGTSNPKGCKFPIAIDEEIVFGVIEIMSVTPEAAKTIDAVPVWTR